MVNRLKRSSRILIIFVILAYSSIFIPTIADADIKVSFPLVWPWDSLNWTLGIQISHYTYFLDDTYLAVWDEDGTLVIPPKLLSTFNSTGNPYYRHTLFKKADSDATVLSPGDMLIFNKSAYPKGVTVTLAVPEWDTNQWYILGSGSVGTPVYVNPSGNLPPPLPINPFLATLIISGIASLPIGYVLAKGKIAKKSHKVVLVVVFIILIGVILFSSSNLIWPPYHAHTL